MDIILLYRDCECRYQEEICAVHIYIKSTVGFKIKIPPKYTHPSPLDDNLHACLWFVLFLLLLFFYIVPWKQI
jgi:hypothetical protein